MPTYRVSIANAASGEPAEILIEAPSAAEARNIAASRGHRSTSISVVADTDPVDRSQVIRKPERVESAPAFQQITVFKIAWGVFLGLMMFFVCIAFVSCLAGGRVYIG